MQKIRKAIIPAAGFGTRFLPATKAMPKEMLPIVDKPTIQYIAEEILESGIDQILIISGHAKRAIEDHFDSSPELESHLYGHGKMSVLKEIKKISSIKIHDFGDVLQLAETGDMLELVAGLALLPFLVGVLMPAGRALAVVEQHFGLLGQHTFRGNVVVAAVDVGVLGVVGQVRLVWLEWFTILLWSFIIIT